MEKFGGTSKSLLVTPFIEVHEIFIKEGGYCSLHKHQHKWNAFYLISGMLEIHIEKENYKLTDITTLHTPGDFTTVKPGEFHLFKAMTDVEALEIYYPEPLSEDIIRNSCGGLVEDNN